MGYHVAAVGDDEKKDGRELDADDQSEPDEGEPEEPEERDEPEENGDEGDHKGSDTNKAPSPWDKKAKRAVELWEAGNNAELRLLLDKIDKAPPEEKEALQLAQDFRKRLKPDPVAIGLWLVTLGIFCLLTYFYVLQ